MAQKISVKIAGRTFNLTAASPQQEEVFRLAAEAINKRFVGYTQSHPGKTVADMLSMVALSETVLRIGLQKEMEKLRQSESNLEKDLEQYLKDIEQ
jgi:hypothetical protein